MYFSSIKKMMSLPSIVVAATIASISGCSESGGGTTIPPNDTTSVQGGGNSSSDDFISCSYNYERSACELLAESYFVISFVTGRGNNCPSSVDPDFQFDFADSAFIGDLGTCVVDYDRGPGGLGNFDQLGGVPDNSGSGGGGNGNTTTWTLVDECNDGVGIRARFHEVRNGSRTGFVWPSSTQAFVTSAGGTIERNLSCNAGTSICFGAEPSSFASSTYWGIGIQGTESCSNCCVDCGSDLGYNLRCN